LGILHLPSKNVSGAQLEVEGVGVGLKVPDKGGPIRLRGNGDSGDSGCIDDESRIDTTTIERHVDSATHTEEGKHVGDSRIRHSAGNKVSTVKSAALRR